MLASLGGSATGCLCLRQKNALAFKCALSNTGSFDWLPTNINWTAYNEQFAFSQLGKRYSYLEAVGAGLGFRVNNDEYICSEYAAAIYRRAGGVSTLAMSPTPTDLVQYWLDQGVPMQMVNGAKD